MLLLNEIVEVPHKESVGGEETCFWRTGVGEREGYQTDESMPEPPEKKIITYSNPSVLELENCHFQAGKCQPM